jgi:hypothetical protein
MATKPKEFEIEMQELANKFEHAPEPGAALMIGSMLDLLTQLGYRAGVKTYIDFEIKHNTLGN